jgi:NADP-reducing hydrogenase subunit HndD
MEFISLNIDGHDVQVPHGTTVLDAAQSIDILIPTLCRFPEAKPSGFCRLCVVEVEGYSNLLPACVLEARDGMIVRTQTKNVIESRRMSVELLVAQHPMQCLTCYQNGKCPLQKLATQYGIQQSRFFRRDSSTNAKPAPILPIDGKNPAIVHDPNMCILCGLCIEACRSIQAVDVIDFAHRGWTRTIEPAFGQSLSDVECTACGQCIQLCPVNSFYEKSEIARVQHALRDPSLHVVGLLSPVVGVSIGEEFGQNPGTLLQQQLVAILKDIGFARVFDAGVGVDILILEESYELLTRIQAETQLPMLSSSSPAWIKYIEHFYPDRLSLLSSCKSPVQSLASLVKTYYADAEKIPLDRIFTVSITPCTAEKFERTRSEMMVDGHPAVDACLTTKETASLLKGLTGERLLSIAPQPYDPPFENASGAGDIFGAAGGMVEGVMRTFHELFTGKKLPSPEFENVRNSEGFQEITLTMGKQTIHTVVVHGTGHIGQLMEHITSGKKRYHYVEIKGCPHGCARGGGEPLPCIAETVQARSRALYEMDTSKKIRQAHENPIVKKIYEKFLKKPASSHSQKLLHTKFTQRQRYL